jgi:hypothetical protein
MLKINDLTNTLSRTWDSVSQGWNHCGLKSALRGNDFTFNDTLFDIII